MCLYKRFKDLMKPFAVNKVSKCFAFQSRNKINKYLNKINEYCLNPLGIGFLAAIVRYDSPRILVDNSTE